MIDLTKANKNLWKEVTEHSGDIRNCLSCGSCVAGCPAAEGGPPLLIRRLVRMVVFGLEDELLDDETPWACTTCHACEQWCPMGVHPFEVGLAIRRWQYRNDETFLPPSVPEVFERGHTQAVEKVKDLMKSVGLEEVTPTVVKFPDLLEKFRAMLRETDIVKEHDYMFKV